MGFKSECIFVSERKHGFFATRPTHQTDNVERVLEKFGLRLKRRQGKTDLSEGIYPTDGHTTVGCFEGALFIADRKRIKGAVEFPAKCSLLQSVLRTFPEATVMVMSLHSVTNYFAYALYEQGKLVRAHGGCSDEPPTDWEDGSLLPEEVPHYARSVVRDGQRFFLTEIAGETQEIDSSCYGETLAFAVAGRFFGKPFDCFLDRIEVETVELQSPKRWWQFS
jgi:hypothetical protein